MSAILKQLEGLKRELTITVDADKVKAAYDKRIKDVSSKAKLHGFRPGKVPPQVIEQQFGKQVKQEVLGDLIQSSLSAAVKEHKLNLAGMPEVDVETITLGEPLEYHAVGEVYPEIELKPCDGQTVELPNAKAADAEVEEAVVDLQKRAAEWNDVEDASKSGDKVTIDFEGKIDGEPMENGSATEFELELGSNSMIPGFEDGIMGAKAKAGDKPVLKLKFPDDYHAEEVAGKSVDFNVTVSKVKRSILPELNDEFAEKHGVEKGKGMDGLRAKILENIEKDIEGRVKHFRKLNALNALLAANPITVPEVLIKSEVENLKNMTRQQMNQQGGGKMTPEELAKIELPDDSYVKDAEKRVKLGLLLGEFIKKNELKADEAGVDEKIADMAAAYGMPVDMVKQHVKSNERMLQELEAAALEELAAEKILESVTITNKDMPYSEFVKYEPKADDK